MAFKDFPDQQQGIQILQRSLERERLAHAYLFSGDDLTTLEGMARTLVKTLNCQHPVIKKSLSAKPTEVAIDCCDECNSCRKLGEDLHPDGHWARPESKLRIVSIDQIRELMQQMHLKPAEAIYKAGIIVAADRLTSAAANAFLKTLEEPPQRSILILLTTEPQRVLATIRSRCLKLNFPGNGARKSDPAQMGWLTSFSDLAAGPQTSLMGRYQLTSNLVSKLGEIKERIDTALTARSPLERHPEADKQLQEKWEEELKAAIEAEYRHQRAEMLLMLQGWLRDVWLKSLHTEQHGQEAQGHGESALNDLLIYPNMTATATVARRLSSRDAMDNLRILEQLQRTLATNVQETLALEVGFLKLKL